MICANYVQSSSGSPDAAADTGMRIRRVKRVYDELARLSSRSREDSFVIEIGEDYDNGKSEKSSSTSTMASGGPVLTRRATTVLFISTFILTVMGLIFKGSSNRAISNRV